MDPPSEPGYHLSEDLVDQAISMIAAQQATAPSRSFLTYLAFGARAVSGSRNTASSSRSFLTYLAFGATHSPHQAPQAYLDKYQGRYDEGWDVTRDRWFARQRELDVVGVEAPAVHNGIAQQPVEGISMRPTFDSANAEKPSARTTQYYEMLGHRATYHDGWKAVTLHRRTGAERGRRAGRPLCEER